MRLSVIVPATGGAETLERCVGALQQQLGADDEILTVTGPERASPAFARNEGARRATGDVLVFVDADVVLHPDACERIRERFASRPELTALFGSYDDAPEQPGAVSGFRNLLHHHVHHASAGEIASFWTGIGAVRRPAFDALGGFDTDHYGVATIEDIEFGVRLARRGGVTLLDPGIKGTHLKRWSLPEMVFTDLLYRGAPWVALLLREPEARRGVLNLGPRHQASALLALATASAVARGRPRAGAAALAGFVALNAELHHIVLRRRGPAQAVAAVGLHLVHHLTAIASVPAGVLSFLRKPATFYVADRHRPRGMRGVHLNVEQPPTVPPRRTLTTRPVFSRRTR